MDAYHILQAVSGFKIVTWPITLSPRQTICKDGDTKFTNNENIHPKVDKPRSSSTTRQLKEVEQKLEPMVDDNGSIKYVYPMHWKCLQFCEDNIDPSLADDGKRPSFLQEISDSFHVPKQTTPSLQP